MRHLMILLTLAGCGATDGDLAPGDTGPRGATCQVPAPAEGWICLYSDAPLEEGGGSQSVTGEVEDHGLGGMDTAGLQLHWPPEGCPTSLPDYSLRLVDPEEGHTWQVSWKVGAGGPTASRVGRHRRWRVQWLPAEPGAPRYLDLEGGGLPFLLLDENRGGAEHHRLTIERATDCTDDGVRYLALTFDPGSHADPVTLRQGQRGTYQYTPYHRANVLQVLEAWREDCEGCERVERWMRWEIP